MPKKAVSVTLDETNLLWLRGQAGAAGHRSLSELLDELVGQARTAGRGPQGAIRSVVGTIDLDASDPELRTADTMIRSEFDASLRRPMLVKESRGRRARG